MLPITHKQMETREEARGPWSTGCVAPKINLTVAHTAEEP